MKEGIGMIEQSNQLKSIAHPSAFMQQYNQHHDPATVSHELFVSLPDLITCAATQEHERISIQTPRTGDEIGSVPSCTERDVQLALQRARKAQQQWARYPLRSRADILLRYQDIVLRHQKAILDIIQIESGKARYNALEEVLSILATCSYYAPRAHKLLAPKRRGGSLPLITKTWDYHHPHGVVGIISPWNYPLTLTMMDALPALLAGNAVILKPDEKTPMIALFALKLLMQAGLPADVLQIVTGYGEIIGPPLIAGVDYVNFTGHVDTGRIVARQAAERLISYSLELGGKNPMLVFQDADMDKTVDGALRGCFTNAGQFCMSIERIYVQNTIFEDFIRQFVARTEQLRLGISLDYTVDMGSLISAEQLARAQQHVQDALDKGATLLTGGQARPDIGPFFYEPTIITGVTPDMLMSHEETFAPVIAVSRFADAEQAIAAANDSPYGLNASIWTRNAAYGRELATRIKSGSVNINEAYGATLGSLDAPMGGMKQSGSGRRNGRDGLLKYTEQQTIGLQRFVPFGPPHGMELERYASLLSTIFYAISRIAHIKHRFFR